MDNNMINCHEVIDSIRQGLLIKPKVAQQAAQEPHMGNLRQLILSSDASALIKLAWNKDVQIAGLGIGLMRPIQNTDTIRNAIEQLWQDAPTYDHAWWVMFRLLDYDDLDIDAHRDIFKFTVDNWDDWITRALDFFGDADDGIARLIDRICSPDWKSGKTWVRVLQVAGYNRKDEWRDFVKICHSERKNAVLLQEAIKWVEQHYGW